MFERFARRQSASTPKAEKVATVVVIGSALREGATPRDLDVFTSGNGLTGADEVLVMAWAWGRGITPVPLDVHGGEVYLRDTLHPQGQLIIPVPWGTFPRYRVVQHGPVSVMPERVDGLASALRGEALEPGAFADWRAQAWGGVNIKLGWGYSYPSIDFANQDPEDPLEGVTALRNALRHIGEERGRELIASLPRGEEILAAIAVGARQYDERSAEKLLIHF